MVCSNGTVLNCYAYDPFNNSTGGKTYSGVSTASSLAGNPATSSC